MRLYRSMSPYHFLFGNISRSKHRILYTNNLINKRHNIEFETLRLFSHVLPESFRYVSITEFIISSE